MGKTLEEADAEELVLALIETTEVFERDFKAFLRGYVAALVKETGYESEDYDDGLRERAKEAYMQRLIDKMHSGELDDMLDEAYGDSQ